MKSESLVDGWDSRWTRSGDAPRCSPMSICADHPGVGRYGVDLAAFERAALPSLQEPGDVVVIDELGKMELASTRFVNAVHDVLASARPVLASVHAHRHPVTDRIKHDTGVEKLSPG